MLPRLCLQGISRSLRDRVAILSVNAVQLQLVGKSVFSLSPMRAQQMLTQCVRL